jgi:hypothetical protein
MAERNAVRLLKALLEGTLSGRVRWEQTASDTAYVVSFADESITVGGGSDRDQVFVRISSGDKTVDVYTAMSLTLEGSSGSTLKDLTDLFEQLFVAARRQAMSADDVVEKLLHELEGSAAGKAKK